MNERMVDSDDSQEITPQQMTALADRARALAPFDGQRIDDFGTYQTRYAHPDGSGYVSIYMPVASELQDIDPYVDDTVRIIDRREEELNETTTLVHTTTYAVSPADAMTNYEERDLAFDSQTGEQIGPRIQPDMSIAELTRAYNLNRAMNGPSVLTAARLQKVSELLYGIDPSERF
jgi:hypothetical protein